MSIADFIKSVPFSSGCEVIKFDECGIVAINKKAGRASHPNPKGDGGKPAMVRAAYNFDGEYYSWTDEDGGKKRLYLVNRLDSPTSGVILAAANPEAAEAAKAAFKEKTVRKTYYAVCMGKVFPKNGTWKDLITPTRGAGFVRAGICKGGMPAICKYTSAEFDENGANLTLLKLEPLTGITHQLRVQCAKHGHPILGDATYGNFSFNKKLRAASKINRLFLHCAATALELRLNGKTVLFEAQAPLPDSFGLTMKYNNDIAKHFRIQ